MVINMVGEEVKVVTCSGLEHLLVDTADPTWKVSRDNHGTCKGCSE
jgi:hypothetical protein